MLALLLFLHRFHLFLSSTDDVYCISSSMFSSEICLHGPGHARLRPGVLSGMKIERESRVEMDGCKGHSRLPGRADDAVAGLLNISLMHYCKYA